MRGRRKSRNMGMQKNGGNKIGWESKNVEILIRVGEGRLNNIINNEEDEEKQDRTLAKEEAFNGERLQRADGKSEKNKRKEKTKTNRQY